MIRFTDQHLWNLTFTIIFLGVVGALGIMLNHVVAPDLKKLTFIELLILALASMRLTRLFVYDKITAFFREQFYDFDAETATLIKPARGARRTLADLLSCPWCVGMWAGAAVVFCYYFSPVFWYPILFLAIASAGSILQIFANMIGWNAEHLKHDVKSL